FPVFDPRKGANPHGCRTSCHFSIRAERPSARFENRLLVPIPRALARLRVSKVLSWLRKGYRPGPERAIGRPSLLKIDPTVALAVRQSGEMYLAGDEADWLQ